MKTRDLPIGIEVTDERRQIVDNEHARSQSRDHRRRFDALGQAPRIRRPAHCADRIRRPGFNQRERLTRPVARQRR